MTPSTIEFDVISIIVFNRHKFMDSLCRVRNKMLYVPSWQTVYAPTRTLSWAQKQFATRVHALFSKHVIKTRNLSEVLGVNKSVVSILMRHNVWRRYVLYSNKMHTSVCWVNPVKSWRWDVLQFLKCSDIYIYVYIYIHIYGVVLLNFAALCELKAI